MINGITVLSEITDKIPLGQILLLALISAIVCGLGASMLFDLSVKDIILIKMKENKE